MQNAEILSLRAGEIFHGRYRVVSCLKAGGMGAVYHVLDDKTASPRALKIMLPSVVQDPGMRARFALEATVTGAIVSDHLVRVSDAGIDELTGTPFLVMELLQGHELGSMIAKRGGLPAGEVVTYLRQVALALDKTHAAGIVHRDLKPDNLFATYRDDGSPCVKILDFGVAKLVAQSTAHATSAIGTPVYMAPEQMRGEGTIGPPADLYALGHIAYTLLVGEPYWQEELRASESIFALISRVVVGAQEAPSTRAARRRRVALPPSFDAWFQRATAMHPAHRHDRASTAIADLALALGAGAQHPAAGSGAAMPVALAQALMPSMPASEVSTGRSGATTSPVVSGVGKASGGRHGALLALGALGVVAACGAGLFLLRARSPESIPAPAASIAAEAKSTASATSPDAVASGPASVALPAAVVPSASATASAAAVPSSSAKAAKAAKAALPPLKQHPNPDAPTPTHHGVY
jgi:Protein kinase domain